MKIQSSSISMASTHKESSFTYKESMIMEAKKTKDAASAILTLSQEGEGKSVKDAMYEYQQQEKYLTNKQRQNNAEMNRKQMAEQMAEQMRTEQKGSRLEVNDEYDMKIKMLRRMLAALRGEKPSPEDEIKPVESEGVTDLRSASFKRGQAISFAITGSSTVGISAMEGVGTTGSGTTWQRITAVSGFKSETESTTFASQGIVTTADGRSINFNVEVSMSRGYMEKFDMLNVTEYIVTDPLMINLDTNMGSVSDQKFFFDLDSDGKEEEISFAGKGSGFIALDKNGDGKINDGSELFGTKSGDGFRDLMAYDEDGNGWIDENDSIFDKLKIWTKDENGNDYLLDLKKADVGAIYLKNADTQFSLKNNGQLNGELKKTGIYLKESTGTVGTMNHVDLVL